MAVLQHGDDGRGGGGVFGSGGGVYVCVCVGLLRARSFGCKLFDGVSTDFIWVRMQGVGGGERT